MKRKLLAVYIILVISCIFIGSAISFWLTHQNYLTSMEERLNEEAIIVGELVSLEKNEREISKAINQAVAYTSRITIIDVEGKVIAETHEDIATMENHLNRPEIQEAIETGRGVGTRYSNTLHKEMMYLARYNDECDLIIRIAQDIENINKESRVIWVGFLISMSLALVVSIILAYFFFNRISNPLLSVAEASEKIANGDYKYRIRQDILDNESEVGRVARLFNTMAQNMEKTIRQLDDKTAQLKAMLISMENGVVAVDNHCKITLINPSAEHLLNISKASIGTYFLNGVMNTKMENMIKKTLKKRKTSRREVRWYDSEDSIYRVTVSPIKNGKMFEGAIMLIEDISEIRRLENMRSDFVANVSHELKTPLTSIIGFVETLLSGQVDDPAVHQRFLNIISVEALRLKRLIEDILSLSTLEEESEGAITEEEVDLVLAATEVSELLSETAKAKQVKISMFSQEPELIVLGNIDRVKQMILNLMDNAIKYNRPNGEVSLEIFKKNDIAVIEIEDTGIGIEDKALERLFERFYRVDKGRSRETGGTGLGLAIVKHIVKNMNGFIDVESKKGKGTKFRIEIPTISR